MFLYFINIFDIPDFFFCGDILSKSGSKILRILVSSILAGTGNIILNEKVSLTITLTALSYLKQNRILTLVRNIHFLFKKFGQSFNLLRWAYIQQHD